MSEVLLELQKTLEARKALLKDKLSEDAAKSYVVQLHQKGLNKILEKVGEECTETLLAAKDAQVQGKKEDVIYETADLWFHSMVMLSHLDIDVRAILDELAKRFNLSGLEEKARRKSTLSNASASTTGDSQ